MKAWIELRQAIAVLAAATLILSGCASVYPLKEQSAEQIAKDQEECLRWAGPPLADTLQYLLEELTYFAPMIAGLAVGFPQGSLAYSTGGSEGEAKRQKERAEAEKAYASCMTARGYTAR